MPCGELIFPAVVFLLIFCVNIHVAFAGPSQENTPESRRCIGANEQFQFAGQYFTGGDYERAAAEYERFIYFFPDDDRVAKARYGIGKSWFGAGRFDKAKTAFVDLIKAFPKTDLALRAHVDLSRCHMKLNDPLQAVISLEHLIFLSTDPVMTDTAWYETGWIFVETANWDAAKSSFERISSKNRTDYEIQNLVAELHKAEDIPQKKPGLAGFFSVIPGGGYLYCGRAKDALTAFLLNGGMILAAVSAFENDNPALGAVIGFVESGFYAGNIYGGISSAHKYNKNQTQNFIDNLKRQNRINLLMDVEKKRVGLLFEAKF
jgi:tetratricopeptide (TPR) repeat protein